MTREQETMDKKVKSNWEKIKRVNAILKNTDQMINNFKKYIEAKNK